MNLNKVVHRDLSRVPVNGLGANAVDVAANKRNDAASLNSIVVVVDIYVAGCLVAGSRVHSHARSPCAFGDWTILCCNGDGPSCRRPSVILLSGDF